ncbi:uncharacterized protein LOC117322104 isoform X2 [Pecten maximus]|uniref:uncharacterized protein LOC117322104 isoform X2 n=1 Tax=Pecten maximus TaxID=6579 RepID=UPI0014582338|nr:uncharacterized protein LOC117322104 isoform X2 [Pecten maximus]
MTLTMNSVYIVVFATVGVAIAFSGNDAEYMLREIQQIRQEHLDEIKTYQQYIDSIIEENSKIKQRMDVLERENMMMFKRLSTLEDQYKDYDNRKLINVQFDTAAANLHTEINDIQSSPLRSRDTPAETRQQITNPRAEGNRPITLPETSSKTNQPIKFQETSAKTNQPITLIDTSSETHQPIMSIDTEVETNKPMPSQNEISFITPKKGKRISEAGERDSGSVTHAVGFYAALAPDVSLGDQQDVKFDHVYTNLGQGYEPRDGHFRAPVAGLYLLSATVLSAGATPDDMLLELVKNGANVGQIYATKSLNEGSRVIVLSLDVGDMVWVRHMIGDPGTVANGSHYSTFSGVLISAFSSTTAI